MKIKNTLIITFILLSSCWSSAVLSCSCLGFSHEWGVEEFDLAFTGTVQDFWYEEFPDGKIHYLFKTTEIYKGAIAEFKEVVVHSLDETFCGYVFSTETVYQIYANLDSHGYTTSRCGIKKKSDSNSQSTSVKLVPREMDRTTLLKVMNSLSNMPLPRSRKNELIAAGCKFVTNSTSGGECAREGRDGPTICEGNYISVFSASDGSVGQKDYPYLWDTKSNTFTITEDEYFTVSPGDCTGGIVQ